MNCKKSLESVINIILSWYITDTDWEHNVIAVSDESIIQTLELNSLLENAVQEWQKNYRFILVLYLLGNKQHIDKMKR